MAIWTMVLPVLEDRTKVMQPEQPLVKQLLKFFIKQKMNLCFPITPLTVSGCIFKAFLVNLPYFPAENQDSDAQGEPDPNVQEVVTTETAEIVDITRSAVIMPTIPMALAAAASHSATPPIQPPPRDSTPQDRPVLHSL